MSSNRRSQRIPVIACMIISLILTIAPLPNWADTFHPDWVALTFVYWAIMLPRTYSVGSAWLAGLVLDVAQGTLFGQHALAMCFAVYIAVKFHLQMRVFPLPQMTVTIFALLAAYQFILFWINGVAGITAPPVTYWGPVISGTVLWPVLSMVYSNIQYKVHSGI